MRAFSLYTGSESTRLFEFVLDSKGEVKKSDIFWQTYLNLEKEAIEVSKELYFDNGGKKARGDSSILFDEDCLKLIDIKWQTHNKTVMVVAPFFNCKLFRHYVLMNLRLHWLHQ